MGCPSERQDQACAATLAVSALLLLNAVDVTRQLLCMHAPVVQKVEAQDDLEAPAVELTALLCRQRSIPHDGHLPHITCLEGLAPPWQLCPVHAGTFDNFDSFDRAQYDMPGLAVRNSIHNRQKNVDVSHLLQLTCLCARLAVSADACSALGCVS